ncbi:unnamed protein product, partial [marine sediment metagenome]
YAGEAAGKTYLESAGLSPKPYSVRDLATDDVLVVGPGGARELAGHAGFIGAWLKAGGKLLALGLDQDEVNIFLPFAVTMNRSEHVATWFRPERSDSLLAGVGPADVHIREPRQLPLVTGGADALGDGVLASRGNVVFCQLVPWQFDYANSYNLKVTFRRSSFALMHILGNLGVRADTALLKNLQNPLPERTLLNDVPDVVWLQAPGKDALILPKVWMGLPVGTADPPTGWETADYDDSKWRKIKVPGTWEDQFQDLINLD